MKLFVKIAVGLMIFPLMGGCGHKLPPEDSCHFVQNSQLQRVSWKGSFPIDIYVHESFPQEDYQDLLAAMGQWDYTLGRTAFKFAGVVSGDNNGGSQDGRSVIYMLSNWESDKPREQGRTTIYWTGDEITEADIRINAHDFTYFTGSTPVSGKVHLESLLVHELGHVLGLQHNDGEPSVMATTLANAQFRMKPLTADQSSIHCEYN